MASRRITKSAIDWTSLTTKIPAKQAESYRAMRALTDKYQFKISELPENLPKIDFAEYAKKISNTAMLQEFEKMYSALQVPYPKDVGNTKAALGTEQKEETAKRTGYLAEQNSRLKSVQDLLDTMDSVPPPHKMTKQMFNVYFPDQAKNPNFVNPGIGPNHLPDAQLPELMKKSMFNHKTYRSNVRFHSEKEVDEELYYEQQAQKEKLGTPGTGKLLPQDAEKKE